jgi:hypothetical protein
MAGSLAKKVDPLAQTVVSALHKADITELALWSDLDALSTHTFLEGIEAEPEGVVINADGTFSGVFNVYVTLQYGKSNDNDDGFTTSDSFLAKFDGHFDEAEPVFDHSEVDTSSFSE